MSLDLFEEKLVESECQYTRKPDGTIVMPCEGVHTIHPVIVVQEGSHLVASIRFPVPAVSDVLGLCGAIKEFFVGIDEITVLLSDAGRILSLSARSTYINIEESLQVLGNFADDLHTLFEHLREHGWWEPGLVRLALLRLEHFDGNG